MNELPISSPYRSTPDAPVTETEREQLTARLNDAYADGRLEAEDYQHRLDVLYAAHRLGELVPVAEGLPALPTYREPGAVQNPPGKPGELAPAHRPAAGVTVLVVGGIVLLVALVAVILIAVVL